MAKDQSDAAEPAPMDVEETPDAKKGLKEDADAKKKEDDKTKKTEEELSEEDAALKSELEMLVERLQVFFRRVETRGRIA